MTLPQAAISAGPRFVADALAVAVASDPDVGRGFSRESEVASYRSVIHDMDG